MGSWKDKTIALMRPPGDLIKGLIKLIDTLPNNLTMLEIGCYTGESSELFLKSGKISKFYAMDPWTRNDPWNVWNQEGKYCSQYFDCRLEKWSEIVVKIEDYSYNALPKLNDNYFDFIYIDALHDKVSVEKDILMSLEKLKPGGIIAGHDYKWENDIDYEEGEDTEVYLAVEKFFPKERIEIFPDTSWLVRNPK